MATATASTTGRAPGRLVTVVVSSYPDAGEDFAKAIAEQVEIVTDWAGVPDRFTHLPVDPPTAHPAQDVDRARYALNGLDADDAVLLYVTGHGERLEQSREHRLLLPDWSGYRTADLVEAAMTSGAAHVAVLVDSCHAGTLNAQINNLLQDIRQAKPPRVTLPASCCVIVSGHPDQPTRLREFATVMRRALDLLSTDKFAPPAGAASLSPQLFFDVLREASRGNPVVPQWGWPPALEAPTEPCLALPNPVFALADVVAAPAVREVALTAGQAHGYWVEKASGRPDAADPGWLLSVAQDADVGFVEGADVGA
jgi:hypothetical protein